MLRYRAPFRDYEEEKRIRKMRRENRLSEIEAEMHNYIQVPLEYRCKTCVNDGSCCYLPRTTKYPNGDAGAKCACCHTNTCSFFKLRGRISQRKLQSILDSTAAPDATRSATRKIAPQPQATTTNPVLNSGGDQTGDQTNDPAFSTRSVTTLAKQLSSTTTDVSSAPSSSSDGSDTPSSITIASTSSQHMPQSTESDSSSSVSKRSWNEVQSDQETQTPSAKVPRLDHLTLDEMISSSKLLNGELRDRNFCTLLLGLIKQHEAALESRDEVESVNAELQVEIEKNEGIIRGLQTQKTDLKRENRDLVVERDGAEVKPRDAEAAANDKIATEMEKHQEVVKTAQAEKVDLEEKIKGLAAEGDAQVTAAKERKLKAADQFGKLKLEHARTRFALAATQYLLKEADDIANEAIEKEAGRETAIKEAEMKMEEDKKKMSWMTKKKDELQAALGKETEATRAAKQGIETQKKEIEELKKQRVSAILAAKASEVERKTAQAALADSVKSEDRLSNKLEEKIIALDAAEDIIQQLLSENEQHTRVESTEHLSVKAELSTLQAIHQQLEADKTSLEAENEVVKVQVDDLKAKLQVTEGRLVEQEVLEKKLVAAEIKTANYKQQRDDAVNHLVKSDKARTELKRNFDLKSVELYRLYADIRTLKGGKPKKEEGAGRVSGSVGEVDDLIDVSMED